MRYNYMICPVQDLSMSVFTKNECTPNNAFVWRELPVPASVSTMLEPLVRSRPRTTSMPMHPKLILVAIVAQIRRRLASIPWAPFQLHSVVMATFASLVAPFGGFFASGFKRAFGIKGAPLSARQTRQRGQDADLLVVCRLWQLDSGPRRFVHFPLPPLLRRR